MPKISDLADIESVQYAYTNSFGREIAGVYIEDTIKWIDNIECIGSSAVVYV